MNFTVTPEDHAKIDKWLMEEVYPPIIVQQREAHAAAGGNATWAYYDWEAGYPDQGASGGGVTYEFTPTGLGTVFKVKAYDQELDLTDYGSW